MFATIAIKSALFDRVLIDLLVAITAGTSPTKGIGQIQGTKVNTIGPPMMNKTEATAGHAIAACPSGEKPLTSFRTALTVERPPIAKKNASGMENALKI